MKKNNIQISVEGLLKSSNLYVVPLYQRNFAWGNEEITQFVQDVYESFLIDSHANYFVGSIVYIRRSNKSNDFEIIDGQQRLTVITLLAKFLAPEKLKVCKLSYDSRLSMSVFLDAYYKLPLKEIYLNEDKDKGTEKLIDALDYIRNCELDPMDSNIHLSNFIRTEKGKDFIRYFFHHVTLVLAEMPGDTDVATYFEIMNNSGEQLQMHEIIKSRMMDLLRTSGERADDLSMENFAKVWDACSLMDKRIEENFLKNEREMLFGQKYSDLNLDNIWNLSNETNFLMKEEGIDEIIVNHAYGEENKTEKSLEEGEDYMESYGDSIIDFPNFLMHVFRLIYNQEYKEKTNGDDIPLNEKDLVRVYGLLQSVIDPVYFIGQLLFIRVLLDRFIVRSGKDGGLDRWELLRPSRYVDEKRKYVRLLYINTFKDLEDPIIKALSMLQVSYPQRKYKQFLFDILHILFAKGIDIDEKWYLEQLNRKIVSLYNSLDDKYQKADADILCLGTSTPRFVLNFVDYLYYYHDKRRYDFDFRYYNSVEHHLPQSSEAYNDYGREVIDSIGNLCLISKRVNSSLNDNDPISKTNKVLATHPRLAPKRSIMYELTCTNNRWDKEDIVLHKKEVETLVGQRMEILGLDVMNEDSLLSRALWVTGYTGKFTGCYSKGLERINFGLKDDPKYKQALEKVYHWQMSHPDQSLEKYIDEVIASDLAELEEWQRIFALEPSVVEYCGCKNYLFVNKGKIWLMQGERATVDTTVDMAVYLLYLKSINNGVLDSVNLDSDTLGIDSNGLYVNIGNLSLFRKALEMGKYTFIRVWLDDVAEHWCYALCSERRSNAAEIKILVQLGWNLGESGYYLESSPYLANYDMNHIELSVQKAYNALKDIVYGLNCRLQGRRC